MADGRVPGSRFEMLVAGSWQNFQKMMERKSLPDLKLADRFAAIRLRGAARCV